MIQISNVTIDLVLILAMTLILGGVVYLLVLLVLSRFEPKDRKHSSAFDAEVDAYDVVFLIPCLNEAEVISASLDRLTSLNHPKVHILVIDDGSDDATAQVVRANTDPRINLLRRIAPNARLGKGAALNEGIEYIRSGGLGRTFDPETTIVCVVDADGRLEPEVLDTVLPRFTDPDMGGVQIGVRINNRHTNILARMQDIEFVLYTEVFQRGRRHLDSVGLGGNGQFVRLNALNSLGQYPWTKSLAEDLDLGIRLMLGGWNTDFCASTVVHQQGLVDTKRWLKQRTRWFQGHLQAWQLMPRVLGNLQGKRRLDLGYHITSPYLLLVGSLMSVAFGLWVLDLAVAAVTGTLVFSAWWISSYLVAFGPVLAFSLVYWRQERVTGFRWFTGFVAFHLFPLYATLWYLAGWRAVFRLMIGRSEWSKTDRIQEPTKDAEDAADPTTLEPQAVAA